MGVGACVLKNTQEAFVCAQETQHNALDFLVRGGVVRREENMKRVLNILHGCVVVMNATRFLPLFLGCAPSAMFLRAHCVYCGWRLSSSCLLV